METTSGLVSAYQLVDYSAQIVVRQNLASTGAEEFVAKIVTLSDLLELREMELVKVKVPPRYEYLAITILSKKVPLGVLAGSILIMMRRALRILQEAGIPYEVTE
jgi:hypothetical protein